MAIGRIANSERAVSQRESEARDGTGPPAVVATAGRPGRRQLPGARTGDAHAGAQGHASQTRPPRGDAARLVTGSASAHGAPDGTNPQRRPPTGSDTSAARSRGAVPHRLTRGKGDA